MLENRNQSCKTGFGLLFLSIASKVGGVGGPQVGRRVSVTTDMYADRANGGNNTRKRSIRDRLGGNVEQLAPVRQPNTKRLQWSFQLCVEVMDG
jgi:hypothetical protein